MTSQAEPQKTALRSIYEASMGKEGGNKFFFSSSSAPPVPAVLQPQQEKEETSDSPAQPQQSDALTVAGDTAQYTLFQLFCNLNREIKLRWPENNVGARFIQTHDAKDKWLENKYELKSKAKLKLREAKRKLQQKDEQQQQHEQQNHAHNKRVRKAKPSQEEEE